VSSGLVLAATARAQVPNGGFESGDLTGWTTSGPGPVSVVHEYPNPINPALEITPARDSYFAVVPATNPATSLESSGFGAKAGQTLSGFLFYATSCPDGACQNPATVSLFAGANQLVSELLTLSVESILPSKSTGWLRFTHTFQQDYPEVHLRLSIRQIGAADSTVAMLDGVALAAPSVRINFDGGSDPIFPREESGFSLLTTDSFEFTNWPSSYTLNRPLSAGIPRAVCDTHGSSTLTLRSADAGSPLFTIDSLDSQVEGGLQSGDETLNLTGYLQGAEVAQDGFVLTLTGKTFATPNLSGKVVDEVRLTFARASGRGGCIGFDNIVVRPFTLAPDSYTTKENFKLVKAAPGVLGNDQIPIGGVASVSVVDDVYHGDLTLNADGSFKYTPENGFFGSDSFTYQAAVDGNALGAATVTIHVNASGSEPPAAVDDEYLMRPNETLHVDPPGVLGNDSNPAGGGLTVGSSFHFPNGNDLSVAIDGGFDFTPQAGFVGTDSFAYLARNDSGFGETASVRIVVNVPPVSNPDAYATRGGTTLTVDAPGVLGNDVDQEPLTAVAIGIGPDHGTVHLSANGSLTYEPEPGFVGVDSFAYHAEDGVEPGNPATVTIEVTPGDQAPIAVPDSYNGVQDQQIVPAGAANYLLANDSDPDGDPITVDAATVLPTHGTLNVLLPDGLFSYVPDPGFFGVDSFSYRVTDGTLTSNEVTVTLTVQEAVPELNTQPVGGADYFEVAEGSTTELEVLDNDVDTDGDEIVIADYTEPAVGTLVDNDDASFTYTAPASPTSTKFYYVASDGKIDSQPVFVKIRVNARPVVADDLYDTGYLQELFVGGPGVLANDSDPEGRALTAQLAVGAAHGTVTLLPDGAFGYQPESGFVGTDLFAYRAVDDVSNVSATYGTVRIRVTGPIATTKDDYVTAQAAPLAVAAPGVLANDSKVCPVPATAVLESGVAHGTLDFDASGAFVYTPPSSFNGKDSFTYKALCGVYLSASTTVTIDVTAKLNIFADGFESGDTSRWSLAVP
jgi:hypothetical protein